MEFPIVTVGDMVRAQVGVCVCVLRLVPQTANHHISRSFLYVRGLCSLPIHIYKCALPRWYTPQAVLFARHDNADNTSHASGHRLNHVCSSYYWTRSVSHGCTHPSGRPWAECSLSPRLPCTPTALTGERARGWERL